MMEKVLRGDWEGAAPKLMGAPPPIKAAKKLPASLRS